MDERTKEMIRYITGYTVFLLVLVSVLLTGCGNDADVYELFLNGELTVEKEEEQLTVSELFLDNDIEYCFLDIDGDGSEELHIRDSEAYYVINTVKGKPQIIFSGHAYEHDMCYEPIVVDEPYGILRYQTGYFGFELVEFIEIISADGRWESDGDFYWDDENGNGIMDEADRFGIGYVYDGERIDIEQYMQYREEQIARRTANEVVWTDRRLKDFATWQEAYIDFINKREAYNDKAYSLAYVDSDDVPELFIDTYYGVTGEYIVSFYDGKVRAINPARNPVEEGINYIEYGGLLYTWDGNHWESGLFHIYMLEKGGVFKDRKRVVFR